MRQPFSRAMRILAGAVLLMVSASSAEAFSILGHRVIALRVLHAVRKEPEAYPQFLSRIAADQTLIHYFLAGTDAPDLGAIDGFPRPNIQYSTHYEHPGLWIKTLFALARNDNERAFAWGWVVHEGADLDVHPWMDEHGLNYCDVPLGLQHSVFEMMMDGRFGAVYAEYSDEGVRGDSLQATRLLRAARASVLGTKTHSPEYDQYLARLHKRCKAQGLIADVADAAGDLIREMRSANGDDDETAAPLDFRVAKEVELFVGTTANAGLDVARELRRQAAVAPSKPQRALMFTLATALEVGKMTVPDLLRTADNAEIVGFYGFAAGKIQPVLKAAGAGDWRALDVNFDTAEAVGDPSLAEHESPGIDIAIVLDVSGSMRENDPDDLRKRAAELLIDRSPDTARFTVVAFNHDTSILAAHASDRAELRRAIGGVGADGGTLICKAAYTTLKALASDDAKQKAIVLLTDGLSQDNCDPGDLASSGVPIFTVGLSPAANGALLQSIAARTNASYVHARTAADVQSVFDIMIAQVLHESAVADFSGTAAPGATSRFRLPVDATIRALTVLLTWPGSDLDLTLLSPSGKHFAASAEGRSAATYEMLHVDAPEPGVWTAAVKSVQVSAGGEPFRLRAAADTPVRVQLDPIDSPGSPMMRATLDGFPAAMPSVRARVERPDGRIDDADVQQDGRSFIGRYSRADIPGAYNFVWSVLDGAISRVGTRSIFVGDMAIQGGTIQSVDGQYARWNRGSLHGIRHGLPVRIFRQGQEIGRGRATDIRPSEADIEIDSVTGALEIGIGDEVQVEIADWSGDGLQP